MKLLGIVILAANLLLCGCVNVLPMPAVTEQLEAKALGRTLRALSPQSRELQIRERDVANGLKVTLDESTIVAPDKFHALFDGFSEQFVEVHKKRLLLIATIGEASFKSAMVFSVQHHSMLLLQDENTQTDIWIRAAQNVRLRLQLGQGKEFPELLALSHQLEAFLALTEEEPLITEFSELQQEFGFADDEIR